METAAENTLPNRQAGPVQVAQAAPPAIPTLLGRATPRIPVAGRIRAGIKVLTRRAAENDRVRAIYERGVAQGKSFDAIEREIADAAPELKNPLTPKNVPYFTVRGEDFPNPEIARQITRPVRRRPRRWGEAAVPLPGRLPGRCLAVGDAA